MNPQNENEKNQGLVHLQEQINNDLQDTSLPAAQVLTQQAEAREPNQRAPLYVP